MPVARIGELLGSRIVRRALPSRRILALQFGAEAGDDASIAALAEQVGCVARRHDLTVVLIRAGAAPWHDDIDVLRRFAALLDRRRVSVFESLDVWEICALVASARSVLASSLHVRIVAESFGRPAVSLLGDERGATGQAGQGFGLRDDLVFAYPQSCRHCGGWLKLGGTLDRKRCCVPETTISLVIASRTANSSDQICTEVSSGGRLVPR